MTLNTRRAGWLLALLLTGGAGADRTYRVQAGDTLYSLARTSGVSVGALQALNGLHGSALGAGQHIRLPDRNKSGRGTGRSAEIAAKTPAPVWVTGVAATGVPALPVARPSALPAPTVQRGMAVYYPGRPDSRTPLTAAHLTLPKGSWVQVTHARTGRSVLVLINDRGPFGRPERIIDLSSAAARVLGIMGEGVAPVTLSIARIP